MQRLFALLILTIFSLLPVRTGLAQDANDTVDFRLTETFVRQLAQENTILFHLQLSMDTRSRTVHTLKNDCEIHIAARSREPLAWPAAVVVEPPNLCKERAPGMPKTSERRLREVLWPQYLDDNVMGHDCEVTGFPRIFTEHAAGTEDPANPNHVLELHPALRITCGSHDLDMRSFLKAYKGMRQISPDTAASCVGGRRLFVRTRDTRYEFREQGGRCGNFAVFSAVVDPSWVRKISGGHSAIARVSPSGRGSYSLKLYTFDGTREDQTFQAIEQGSVPRRRLYYHGMFTYDYFSILRTVRDRAGVWSRVTQWTEVRFPLAFVIFGETEIRDGE